MRKPDWTSRTYDFSALEQYAAEHERVQGIVKWLKIIGVIPDEVSNVRPTQVRLELDPNAINGGYLASVAYEWDSWGTSTPRQFLRALRCELKGATQRDTIAEALGNLGRGSGGYLRFD